MINKLITWLFSKKKVGYVYIAVNLDSKRKLIKIGMTESPKKRISGMRSSAPRIEFKYLYECRDHRQAEKITHKAVERYRVEREWFSPKAEKLARRALRRHGRELTTEQKQELLK